jgi:hypothetical protein
MLFALTATLFVLSMTVALIVGREGVALALGAAGAVLLGLARLAKVLLTAGSRASSDDSNAPRVDQEAPSAGNIGGLGADRGQVTADTNASKIRRRDQRVDEAGRRPSLGER